MLGVSDFFRPKGEDNPELQVDKSNEAPHDFSSHLSKRTFDFCFDNSKGQIQTLGLIEHDTPYMDLTNESNQGLRRDGKSRFQIETDELQKVRQSQIKLRQSREAQKGEINSLNQSLKQNERDLQDVRTKLANTQEELTLCKDDLFRLQPAAQVPDTDILKDFDQLCENIVSWIDDELLSFENASPNAQTNQIFSDGGSIHAAHLLHEYPNIGEYLVRHEVHHRLQNSILDPDTYLLGLNDGTVTVLKEVERSMLHSTPPRGRTPTESLREF